MGFSHFVPRYNAGKIGKGPYISCLCKFHFLCEKKEEYTSIDNLDISIITICFHMNFEDKMLLKIITVLLKLNLIESSL